MSEPTPKPGRKPKYTVHVMNGTVQVFHPYHATPLECSEQQAGVCIAMHHELVAEVHRLASRLAGYVGLPLEECVGGEFTAYRELARKLEEQRT